MLKKFDVSLACMMPANYDVQVEAQTEAEAVRKAIADFQARDFRGYVTTINDGEPMLDVQNPDYRGQDVSKFIGVDVYEIEENEHAATFIPASDEQLA